MTIDLGYSAEARDLAAAVRKLCSTAASGTTTAPDHWLELANMGVLGLAVAGTASAEVLAASMIELGRAGARGPLLGVIAAGRLLDSDRAQLIAAGLSVPAIGRAPLLPWAPLADVFILLDGETAYLAALDGSLEPIDTLAGEPWGRCSLIRQAELAGWSEAKLLVQIGAASYLLGAGQQLLENSVTYAASRKQFGRPIGDFQAVSHPLANSHLSLAAVDALVRLAAHALDAAADDRHAAAAAALASAATATTDTAYRAHQTLGAMGFTVEGPIGRLSALIRQTAATAIAMTDPVNALLAPYDL